MNKRTIITSSIIALAVFIFWAPKSDAYPTFSSCVGCHSSFTGGSGSTGHSAHLGLGLPQSCNTCHVSIGDTPAMPKCAGCHVAPGLPMHHQNAGASSCTVCHYGNPAPENTPVPGYASITAQLNPCDGSEELFPSFTIGLDNDGDLLYDADDPDCQVTQPQPEANCVDGIDNDNDGLIDCDDQDCQMDNACITPLMETNCIDGLDNDSDGFIDCADSDCSNDVDCQTPATEICDDGIDNDGDMLIDCNDQDCAASSSCQTPQVEDCSDGVDNDGDGIIDCDDQDCQMDPVCITPLMETNCTDGLDNDNDSFIDCRDPDCSTDPNCQINHSPQNGHTDDEDGFMHKPGKKNPFTNGCTSCHGSDLRGGFGGPSCYTCHGKEWDERMPGAGNQNPGSSNLPDDHTDEEDGFMHKPGKKDPFTNGCTNCHGSDLLGDFGPSCFSCHGKEWDEKSSQDDDRSDSDEDDADDDDDDDRDEDRDDDDDDDDHRKKRRKKHHKRD